MDYYRRPGMGWWKRTNHWFEDHWLLEALLGGLLIGALWGLLSTEPAYALIIGGFWFASAPPSAEPGTAVAGAVVDHRAGFERGGDSAALRGFESGRLPVGCPRVLHRR